MAAVGGARLRNFVAAVGASGSWQRSAPQSVRRRGFVAAVCAKALASARFSGSGRRLFVAAVGARNERRRIWFVAAVGASGSWQRSAQGVYVGAASWLRLAQSFFCLRRPGEGDPGASDISSGGGPGKETPGRFILIFFSSRPGEGDPGAFHFFRGGRPGEGDPGAFHSHL